MNKLERSGLVDLVNPLVDWLPSQPSTPESLPNLKSPDLKSRREKIKTLAEKLVYAETAEIGDFLATIPLKQLALDHQRQLPITVVVGAVQVKLIHLCKSCVAKIGKILCIKLGLKGKIMH